MKAANVRSAYQQSEAQAKIHPVRLIQLMYERLLVHLEIAEDGMVQNDAKIRGENLSRAIALVTELNASIKEDDDSGAAEFLRALYSSILLELPKAVVSNDVEIVRMAARYIQRLKDVWEKTAVVEAGLDKNRPQESKMPSQSSAAPAKEGVYGGGKKYGVASSGGLAVANLSVSI